jgi:hypothetical protein
MPRSGRTRHDTAAIIEGDQPAMSGPSIEPSGARGDAGARNPQSCSANVVERGFQAGESTWASYCCARLC